METPADPEIQEDHQLYRQSVANKEMRSRPNLAHTKLVNSEIFEVPEEDSESTYKQGPTPSKHSSSKFKEVIQAIEEDFQSKTISKDRSNASQVASESEDLDGSGLMAKEAKKAIAKFIGLMGEKQLQEKSKLTSFRTSQEPVAAVDSHRYPNSVANHDTVSLPDQNQHQVILKGFKKKGTDDIVQICVNSPDLLASPQSGLHAACGNSVAELSQHSLEKYTHVTTNSRQVPSRFKPKIGGGGSVDVGNAEAPDGRSNAKALSSYHKKAVTAKEREYSESSMISSMDQKKSFNELGKSSKSEFKRSNTGLSKQRPGVTLAAVSELQPRTQGEDELEDNLVEPQETSVNAAQVASIKASSSQKFHKSKTIGSPGRQGKSKQAADFDDYLMKAGLDRSKGFITKNKRMMTEDSINSSKLSSQRDREAAHQDPPGIEVLQSTSNLGTQKLGINDDRQESGPNNVVVREAESHYEMLTKSRVSQASSGTGKKLDGEHLLSGEFGC